MKAQLPSRKLGTLIFSFLMLAAAALVVGMLVLKTRSSERHSTANPRPVEARKSGPRKMPISPETSAAEREATAKAQPCDNTVLTHLDLTRPPSQAELIAAGNLGKKLTPTRNAEPANITDLKQRKQQEAENLAFGTAIQAWNEHRYSDSLKLLEDFLAANPESPWAAETMLHIGCFMQFNARFGEAAEWFDKAIAAAGDSKEMFHKAKIRRSIINIDLGHLDEASKSLAETLSTNTDSAENTYTSYWIKQTSFLKKHEAELRDCGQKALAKAAEILGDKEQSHTFFNLPSAGAHGFTAAELYATAVEHGCDPHPVQAALALDQLPLPFIAHYKDKHYVTVESVTPDAVQLYDSRVSGSTRMPRTAFEREWSGFAMLMRKPPNDQNIHPAENLDNISGGCCGVDRLVEDLGKDENECASCGLPSYSVSLLSMNFKVIDTPMWWDAPVGPDVYMTQLFNSQDSQNSYAPFGQKWSFEYASYLMITPAQLQTNPPIPAKVDVRDGDGKIKEFTASSAIPSGYPVTYNAPPGDFRTLVETADHVFTLTRQDGTVYHYGLPVEWIDPNGPNYTPPPPGYVPPPVSSVPMLLKIEDRHHNAITVRHNVNAAVVRVEHSALPGQAWKLVYGGITIGTGTVSRVIRIDDPFTRSAHYAYDSSGRLTSQTDMGGLIYSYQYTDTTAGDPLFITAITTPTGTTTVHTEPSDGIENRADVASYPQTDRDNGYRIGYPLPGRIMWDNYRITTRDHANNPSEYHYDAERDTGATYLRTPAQMVRQFGSIAPQSGSRREIILALVGTRAVVTSVKDFREDKSQTSNWVALYFDEQTLLPAAVWNGQAYDEFTYNTLGRPTSVEISSNVTVALPEVADYLVTLTYQANGIDPDMVTRPLNGTAVTLADYEFYDNRDLKSVTVPSDTDTPGRKISYQWYGTGLLKQISDSKTNDLIEFFYDTNLRPKSVKVNNETVLATTYDSKGNLIQSLDSTGRETQYSYDNLERLTRELRPDNTFTAYDWACCFIETVRSGKVVNNADRTLHRSVTLHDSRALPTSTMDSDGRVTRFEYDLNGRLIKLIDPRDQTTEWIYNAADQLTSKKYPVNPLFPNNSTESFTYYSSGRMQTFTNRRNQTTQIIYDEVFGEVASIVPPVRYDPPGSGILAEASLEFDRDSWGRVSQITQGASTTTNGGIYMIGHDIPGRVTSLDGPWADDTISYTYDAAARSFTRTSPGGMTQTTAANAIGQTASVANILGTFTNAYDGIGGLLTSITHTGTNAGFNTAFTYHGDAFDRALASITSTKPGGATIGKHSYTYDSLGNIATWKRESQQANPVGATRQFESKVFYDLANQVSSVIHNPLSGSSVVESAQHYIYDAAGNIASKQVETPGAASIMTPYSHNSLNQITALGGSSGVRSVTVRGSTSESAKVKAKTGAVGSSWENARMLEGNRFEADLDLANGANEIDLQARDGSYNYSNYSYGITLAAAAAKAPTYDADGNMTSDGTRDYAWDSQSRLTKINWGGGSNKTTEFKYNALGQRGERIDKTGTTENAHFYYLYDGIHFVCRYTGGTATTNVDRRYYSQGEQRKNGASWDSYYYTRDHLGSIREVMSSDGTLAARYDYDPFGKRSAEYASASYTDGCDLGYTGHITQPSLVAGQTELVMTQFRAYAPELGRWLSPDPIREKSGLNLYKYVRNRPIANWDPFGLHDVVANYYIREGLLSMSSLSVGWSVVAKMESGAASYKNGCYDPSIPDYRNNPDFQHVKSPDGASGPAGPIPEGVYKIVVRPGLKYDHPAYRLVPLSGNAIKYHRGGPKGPFVIHFKSGIGCIVPGGSGEAHEKQYNKIVEFMNQIKPNDEVYGILNVHRGLRE